MTDAMESFGGERQRQNRDLKERGDCTCVATRLPAVRLCSCVCGKVTRFFSPVCTTECNSDCVLNKIQLEIQLCVICDDEKVSLSVT